jgi:succinyldiaminopimelate transaminase
VDPDAVLPTIGSKELVAGLPMLLGLGPGDAVAYPHVAYPTYDVGARLAGAASAPYRDLDDLRRRTDVRLVWLNSPGNPTGAVCGAAEMAALVAWARERGVVVASDECYAELGWDDVEVVSVLDPRVCGHSHRGVLAVYSLSKQSSMAGYRAGLVAGDPVLVAQVLEVRKHAGLMVPWPVQQAIIAALGDDEHVAEQKGRYGRRRALLLAALRSAGFTVESSEAGLYLWATRGQDGWVDVEWFAARGILVAPGDFYGASGARHVRCALTASDERVDAAVQRLTL